MRKGRSEPGSSCKLQASGASVVYEYALVFDGKQACVKTVDELLGAGA